MFKPKIPGIVFATQTPTGTMGGFPEEFRGAIRKRIDLPFLIAFSGIFIVVATTILILSYRSLHQTVSNQQIIQIQERYAQLVLEQPVEKIREKMAQIEQPVPKVVQEVKKQVESSLEKEKAAPVDRSSESVQQQEQRREETKVDRAAKREEVKKIVNSSGIFAAITASTGVGGKRRSAAVADLLSGTADVVSAGASSALSKELFSNQGADGASSGAPARRGEKIKNVEIKTSAPKEVEVAQFSSTGSINIASEQPEIKSGTGEQSSRTQESINEVVLKQQGRMKKVFENMLKQYPELSGKLQVKFVINPDGSVNDVVIVQSTINNAEFEKRILSLVELWRFPPVTSGGPIEVIYPFIFTKVG